MQGRRRLRRCIFFASKELLLLAVHCLGSPVQLQRLQLYFLFHAGQRGLQ